MLQVELPNRLLSVLNSLGAGRCAKAAGGASRRTRVAPPSGRYQLTDRLFRQKYGATLDEFEAAEVVKTRGYSFEVENDHQDWDLAVDGIHTVERQLASLRVKRDRRRCRA
ncbi:hypothetical protein [Candidatus Amarolinea dominans]|uniref:hypothetical protein n=1 Tax=Candidatus Amarolinea dominans TaxID=3140696 RepID=UPI0031365449|nr:hypothetical protein [Anaerolineae bacterium]